MNEDWTESHDAILESIEETLDIKPGAEDTLLARLEQVEEQVDLILELSAGAYKKLEHIFEHLVGNLEDD